MDFRSDNYGLEVDDNAKDDTAIANELLGRVNLPKVSNLSECTSSVFVELCEGILGDTLQGIVYAPVTREDEIHNVQLVVDHLANRVLHCDLSHISGGAIVDGDRVTMQYLLEILLGVMDYIMEGIDESGQSTTDNDDDNLVDPDTMTRGTVSAITDVLRQELGRRNNDVCYEPTTSDIDRPYDTQSMSSISKNLSQPNSQSEGESTAKLIKPPGTTDGEETTHQQDALSVAEPAPTSHPLRSSQENHHPKSSDSIVRYGVDHLVSSVERSTPPSHGPGTVSSSTASPVRQKDELSLQDLTASSFSAVSWPKPLAAGSHRLPSEFDSLGVRPRPAVTKERPLTVGFGSTDSLTESLQQHHVHTHHHYHQPAGASQGSDSDDAAKPTTTNYRPRQTHPPLPSTHAAPSAHAASSTHAAPLSDGPPLSRSIPGRSTKDEAQTTRQQGNILPHDDVQDGLTRRPKVSGLPPRLRRVAFKEESEDSSHRSFYRETLGMLPPRLGHESSDENDSKVSYQSIDRRHHSITRQPTDFRHGSNDTHHDADHHNLHPRDLHHRHDPLHDHLHDPHHEYDLRPRRRPSPKKHLPPRRRPKSVLLPSRDTRSQLKMFEDALEMDAGTGPMHRIRKRLNKENKKHCQQKQVLRHVYKSNLDDAHSHLKQQLKRNKRAISQQDTAYRKVFSGVTSSKYQPANKYSVAADRPSRSGVKTPLTKRKRSASASPTMHRHKRLSIDDDEMLPTVMTEFPFLHVSPQTAHNNWVKQMRQMELLTKMGLDQQYRKTKAQLKMEEAERRQEILLGIMKKELAHNQRMRDIKEKQSKERALRYGIREQRQVNARARRYYDEFAVRAQSRLLKKKTREEQIFKRLFEDGLKIQKARITELRKYAQEKREESSKKQQDEIDSLENYYRDQFSMLAETIAKERHDLQTRDNAQTKVMDRMKHDLRRKMEQEIRDFQEQMYRDEDTDYYRQLEADRIRRELHMASYKTNL